MKHPTSTKKNVYHKEERVISIKPYLKMRYRNEKRMLYKIIFLTNQEFENKTEILLNNFKYKLGKILFKNHKLKYKINISSFNARASCLRNSCDVMRFNALL